MATTITATATTVSELFTHFVDTKEQSDSNFTPDSAPVSIAYLHELGEEHGTDQPLSEDVAARARDFLGLCHYGQSHGLDHCVTTGENSCENRQKTSLLLTQLLMP